MQLKTIIIACLAGLAAAVPIHSRSEAGAEGIVNPTPLCEFKRGVGCDSKRSDVLTEGLAEPSPLFELKRGVGLESKEPEALASESVGVTELAEFKSRSDDLDANPEPSPFL